MTHHDASSPEEPQSPPGPPQPGFPPGPQPQDPSGTAPLYGSAPQPPYPPAPPSSYGQGTPSAYGQEPRSPYGPGPQPQYPSGQQPQYPSGQLQPFTPQGPPPQYGAPPQYVYAPAPPKNDLGVWSLVTGILSWVVCPFVLGVVAIVTGNASRKAVQEGLANNPGSATAGLVLGWINVALIGVAVLVWVAFLVLGVLGAALSVTQV
ncbi:DUF4190 domain-containing protein [Promicromonospora sp. NPDC052451]|uniref:DUF4190 domain-containing protein n=1 Tax=Promicromonospora sp. NPDC052451 TaxID=3364407 RepID=UPI0037CB158E